MKILVGSRGRLNFPLKKIFGNRITLFVEPQFIEEYKKANPELEMVQLKENNKGFGYMLNSMVDYALKIGEKYFLFSDDDIYGLKKRSIETKLEKCQDIDSFLKEGEIIIKNLNLVQLGVSFQGHNWYWKKPLKMNLAVWGMGFMNVEAIKKVGGYDEWLAIFNDYEITARLLENKYQNAVWYDYAFEHKMRGFEGGLDFIYKQNNVINEAVAYLSRKYPYCTKIIKHEKHQINEIRFNWSKIIKKSKNKEKP